MSYICNNNVLQILYVHIYTYITFNILCYTFLNDQILILIKKIIFKYSTSDLYYICTYLYEGEYYVYSIVMIMSQKAYK